MGILAEHLGEWRSSNAFRLTPDDPPHEAAAAARVSAAVRGFLTEVAYNWSHPETGEQTGLLVLGGRGPAWCHGDVERQPPPGPGRRLAHRHVQDGTITLGYSYPRDWQWRILIDTTDPARLAIRMDNVVPASAAAQGYPPGDYRAMKAGLVLRDR